MRMVGARKIECEVWFIKNFSFAVYSVEGFITLQHHEPERLIGALMSPNVTMVELTPKLEVIRVHLDQPGIPLRFYMTSRELQACY
jgi:fucose 4-O-acetylase-like acetyltransferase